MARSAAAVLSRISAPARAVAVDCYGASGVSVFQHLAVLSRRSSAAALLAQRVAGTRFAASFSAPGAGSTKAASRKSAAEISGESGGKDESLWEEEDDDEAELGDGGDGGGIALGGVSWAPCALAAAREVLAESFPDLTMFAFKASPRGYVYLRLEKLSSKRYGCPDFKEVESYHRLYRRKLDELESRGDVPDLGVRVSGPSAERLLRVPDDLERFIHMPMRVEYLEAGAVGGRRRRDGVFLVEQVCRETEQSFWKLADVKENREELCGWKPLSRKHKDLRIQIPFHALRRVKLYV